MITRIHAIAGGIGFLTILVFMTSTILSELFGSAETIASVKRGILWGLCVMIPAMAIVGGSGFTLARERSEDPVPAKKKRMPIIALNDLLILLPLVTIQKIVWRGQYDLLHCPEESANHRRCKSDYDGVEYLRRP